MIPIWKNIPFLRLLLPFIAGIISSWYFSLGWMTGLGCILTGIAFALYFLLQQTKNNFSNRWLPGVSITWVMLGFGIGLTWLQLIPHQPQWFGHFYQSRDMVELRLLEPPSEREKTHKALAEVLSLSRNGKQSNIRGNIMLYFQKDSFPQTLTYGSILYTNKQLDEIKNAGNPGGFDYKRFALFKGITHQLFLKKTEYVIAENKSFHVLQQFLFDIRSFVLSTIRKYIQGPLQVSVAEALLVGYRDDLDRDLVQAFSNTGVVHIIAISGMHLGLIYVLLLFLLKPLEKIKRLKWLQPILIVSLLWLFSLLTGGGASVLRAVIMFSFITAAGLFQRKGNIYNSLAASAFVLLCYNPFFLWDVGFQLSYAAVLSIVLFMKPIYNWLVIQNKLLDKLWQLNAVTLSAQILTLPLCMYHFHQSPNLFLLANIIAVPLSTLTLYGIILLVAFSFYAPLAFFFGKLVTVFLSWMNRYILWLDRFSFSVTDGIYHTPLETVFLYLVIAATAIWLISRKQNALFVSLVSILCFLITHAYYQYQAFTQQKLIVYNLSQHEAIDVYTGKTHWFKGDSVLLEDGFLRNFHLKPARILYRTYSSRLQMLSEDQYSLQLKNKKILFLNRSVLFNDTASRTRADVVIVSKNPKLYLADLVKAVDCKLIVFDSSNPKWKVERWKKDCEKLKLNYFSTADKGAFVMNL